MKNKTNKWIMEVNVAGKWFAVCPTGGKRYEYDTNVEANRMLRTCYPDETWEMTVRIRQLNDGE